MDLYPFARDYRPALAPVGLALPARRRLESDRRFNIHFLPQRADEPLDSLVAPPIAPNLDLLEYRLGAVGYGRQPLEDIVLIRLQDFALLLFPGIALRLLLTKDLPDGLDAQPDCPRYRLLRLLELESAVDLMPKFTFDHLFSSRRDCREEADPLSAQLLIPFRPGGNFSMTAKG